MDSSRILFDWGMKKALQDGLIYEEIMESAGSSEPVNDAEGTETESSKTPERGNGETTAERITAAGSGPESRVAGEDSNIQR
jgi:hypothetical protein